MKIVVLQENLAHSLSLASKFLPSKSTTLPTISSFLVSSSKGKITITATDLESSIRVVIPGKEEEEGELLLPSKTAISLISSLREGKITLSSKEEKVVIESAGSRVSLQSARVQDFPQITEKGEGEVGRMKKGLVKKIQQKVSFAASSDQTRAVLTGVFFEPEDDGYNLVATDGFRLSLLREKGAGVFEKPVLLSSKVIQTLAGALGEEDEVGVVRNDEGSQIVFSLPNIQISATAVCFILHIVPRYNKTLSRSSTVSTKQSGFCAASISLV